MKNLTQKNGIIYCRVPSMEQVEGTSLETQERACREYAEREGIKVLKIFIEKGESAKTANRTEFNNAIAFCAIKKNVVNSFIVYKVDRFARNQDDHGIVRANLKRLGVELRSATEPIDETPMGRFMEAILSGHAEFDNSIRSIRCTEGMRERLKAGIWVWQAPLGYYRPYKGSNIFPEPTTAHLIKLAFEEYSKGNYTHRKLALFLTERGLRSRAGKAVTPQLLEKILKNPIYCGVIKTWGEFEGTFEPIISKELFTRCQPEGMRSAQSNPRSLNNPLFPLRGFMQCTACGISITGSSSKGRHRKGYPYYHHYKKSCPQKRSIPKEIFEQQFVEYLNDITPDKEYEQLFKAIVLDTWKDGYKRIDEENSKIHKSITLLESDRQKVFDLHRSGKYTDDDFEEQRGIISKKIEAQRLLLKVKWDEEFEMEEVLSYCFDYVRNASKAWIEADYQTKVRLQKLVFAKRIEFDGEKLGTAELRQIYRINQVYQTDKSSLVAPRGVEPLLPG